MYQNTHRYTQAHTDTHTIYINKIRQINTI